MPNEPVQHATSDVDVPAQGQGRCVYDSMKCDDAECVA